MTGFSCRRVAKDFSWFGQRMLVLIFLINFTIISRVYFSHIVNQKTYINLTSEVVIVIKVINFTLHGNLWLEDLKFIPKLFFD